MVSIHPFDRYAEFTDLSVLKDFSGKPLRKSIRVNTLKSSVEAVKKWGEKKNWTMEPVPWCPEGFFIDRVNREEALGRDLLHLVGHFYMQEAASMLPVELLDPKPGESILDMSAAPGSKTTQIAAKMRGEGLIIANDVQEKRLWTLKTALHRAGTVNVIVTRKVGQWFGKHMTERFDRVLCDAPCTAQGTSRKDSDALEYCSPENIGKMAKLQRELLESAVHAAKVGGRIVYSTCTLTPEENEEIVLSILNKFSDQLEIIQPMNMFLQAVNDSLTVQKTLDQKSELPLLRLWPQTYDTEGFFCAVFQKNAPTRARSEVDFIRFQEDFIPRSRTKEFSAMLEKEFGSSMVDPGEMFFEKGDQLILSTEKISETKLPAQDFSLGLPFALRLKDGRIRITHEIATLRGQRATKQVLELSENQLKEIFAGKDITCDKPLHGDLILRYEGVAIGLGLAKEGKLKNRIPRTMVLT